ncbi:MAG: hypothetical protein KatS3mg108_2982 [Isosphaeraceae bacterium]|jgi:hypothetical protein|nr:MAG: hypothetical protein KatS3mg108_2982 [Isosphaeraceae bacterium]
MPSPTPGQILRQLDQQQAALRKVRQVVQEARAGGVDRQRALGLGWEALQATHRLLGSIPLGAADEAVMLRQLQVQRYATALLVRLRRLLRTETADGEEAEEAFDE